MAKSPICSIHGCGNQSVARGWCSKHYQRWQRNGDPISGRTPNGSLWDFINNIAVPYNGDDCLMWPFGRLPNGYADVQNGKKKEYVHRIVCREVYGKPPTLNHEAAHNCGRGHLGCVNPCHLRWATHKENMEDMVGHGKSTRGRHASAKLTESDVREIRSLRRQVKQAELARAFNVRVDTISEIQRHKTWSWIA